MNLFSWDKFTLKKLSKYKLIFTLTFKSDLFIVCKEN